MAVDQDIPAWIALFVGIYALAASAGEFFKPGSWSAMLQNFADNTGLRFLAGIVLIALGAAVYLTSPWRPDDCLAIVVTVVGAGMVLEGVIFLAFGELFMRLSQAMMGRTRRFWPAISAILGLALIAVSLNII